MSTTDDPAVPDWIDTDGTRLQCPPSFELTFEYDDQENPTTVTVSPNRTDQLATTWLSVDVDHAVALDDAR